MRSLWRSLKQIVIAYDWANWVLYFLALGLLFMAVVFLQAESQPIHLARHDFNAMNHCERSTSDPTRDSKFMGYVLSRGSGQTLCRVLGDAVALARHYGSLRFEWSLQSEARGWQIHEKRYDLLAVRPEEMASAGASVRATYREIALYPAYDVFFIARDGQPEMTSGYLRKRTLGVLDDQHSRSGYRIPLDALRRSGLNLREVVIKKYPSHQDLRGALARREVDLIGSYWSEHDRRRYPEWKTLRIGGADRGPTWYVDVAIWQNKEVRCALVEALNSQAKRSNDSYFAELRIVRAARDGCDGG